MKHDNRSFACCFYLEFCMKTSNQTFEGYMYTRLTVGKEVCRSFERRKHVARHRNYRLVLGLRSRYRQKTNNRLPPKNYRRMTLPPKMYRHILVLPPPPKSLPPKNEKPPTAVWHYRPACVRLKSVTDDNPGKFPSPFLQTLNRDEIRGLFRGNVTKEPATKFLQCKHPN